MLETAPARVDHSPSIPVMGAFVVAIVAFITATVSGQVSIDNVTFSSLDVFFAQFSANSSDSLSVSK